MTKILIKRLSKEVCLPRYETGGSSGMDLAAYINVNIEETPHGYAVYRVGESKPFTFIPTSAVKQIEYKE